jgi:hypothetical protein
MAPKGGGAGDPGLNWSGDGSNETASSFLKSKSRSAFSRRALSGNMLYSGPGLRRKTVAGAAGCGFGKTGVRACKPKRGGKHHCPRPWILRPKEGIAVQ